MKNNIIFFIMLITFISIKADAQNQFFNIDSLIRIQNTKIDRLNDILKNQDSVINAQRENINLLVPYLLN